MSVSSETVAAGATWGEHVAAASMPPVTADVFSRAVRTAGSSSAMRTDVGT
jgi:hypothetical protein